MYDHDHFRELSALAATGQLCASEHRELDEHLRECEECREVHNHYLYLVQYRLPQTDPFRWRIKSTVPRAIADPELRDRFLARARAEGIKFSLEAEGPYHDRQYSNSLFSWRILRRASALGAAATLILLGTWVHRRYRLISRSSTFASMVQQSGEDENLRTQLATLRKANQLASNQLSQLRKEYSLSEGSLQRLKRNLQEAEAQQAASSADLRVADSENAGLSVANQNKDRFIEQLKRQNEELSHQRADNLGRLMAVSNDIRELMGERNLHIIDVHDVDEGKGGVKAFGRVFYAEGHLLVFYAFDLSSNGSTLAKYRFQAWGEPNDSQIPRNLGIFQVDDLEQHRWILKLKNPALFSGIYSVFVTAEPIGVAHEPHGRKLLYAYITGQPNHP
jgi:hypothetical protein